MESSFGNMKPKIKFWGAPIGFNRQMEKIPGYWQGVTTFAFIAFELTMARKFGIMKLETTSMALLLFRMVKPYSVAVMRCCM